MRRLSVLQVAAILGGSVAATSFPLLACRRSNVAQFTNGAHVVSAVETARAGIEWSGAGSQRAGIQRDLRRGGAEEHRHRRAAAASAAPMFSGRAQLGRRAGRRAAGSRRRDVRRRRLRGRARLRRRGRAQAPRSVEAHHNRAVALLHLDRLDDARDALALALALAPDDPETLEAAADLNINQLAPSADRSQIGLEYARRGSRHVSRHDTERVARLALLEGQALVDLGRSLEGLHRIEAALAVSPKLVAAQYERGVALFELCRFADARHMFERVLASDAGSRPRALPPGPRSRSASATSRWRRTAWQRRPRAIPKAFPAPPAISPEQFEEHVRRAVANLPPDVAANLAGIQVQAAELPAIDDLTAEKPPLSPTILGLFRGLPLDWKADATTPTPVGRTGQAGRGKKARRASRQRRRQPR